ncbi:glycosyltransferase family 1 protein [Armatimonas sp.]|uniref:glycosyltransferase family 4 protein n=1 Tax=Armatimonas sp. TaxID=1872638 RepID=UPI002869FAB2|nr:glycosyltransferase family 1 protein [Armatimonas sp.]
MKVLLIPNLVEYHAVSMKRYADELTQALHQITPPGWELDSLTCHHVALAAKLLPGNLGAKTAERLGRLVKYPLVVKKNRYRGDIFHILDHSHAHLLKSLPAERTVISCHDIIPLLASLGKLDIAISDNQRRAFPKIIANLEAAQEVITISESSKQNLLEHTKIPAERLHVVYFGINPNFTPEPTEAPTLAEERVLIRKRYNIPENARLLMHVGTTGRYKNTIALIKLLKALGDDVWLLRVGSPFHEDEAALVEQLGVGERIVHAGKIPSDGLLGAHYRAADMFVFPSLWEGLGLPPLEAMACGTPTITSNTASLPEVAGPNGITFSPQDDEEIARVTDSLLRDPARLAKLGSDGLAWSKNFTWQQSAQQTLRVYEKIGK